MAPQASASSIVSCTKSTRTGSSNPETSATRNSSQVPARRLGRRRGGTAAEEQHGGDQESGEAAGGR